MVIPTLQVHTGTLVPDSEAAEELGRLGDTTGRFGKITVENESGLKDSVAEGILAGLHAGDIIKSRTLETALHGTPQAVRECGSWRGKYFEKIRGCGGILFSFSPRGAAASGCGGDLTSFRRCGKIMATLEDRREGGSLSWRSRNGIFSTLC